MFIKKTPLHETEEFFEKLTVVVFAETVSAINRTVAAWTERNLSADATSCASSVMHFTLLEIAVATTVSTVSLLVSSSALWATAWFVGEPFFSEEILF